MVTGKKKLPVLCFAHHSKVRYDVKHFVSKNAMFFLPISDPVPQPDLDPYLCFWPSTDPDLDLDPSINK